MSIKSQLIFITTFSIASTLVFYSCSKSNGGSYNRCSVITITLPATVTLTDTITAKYNKVCSSSAQFTVANNDVYASKTITVIGATTGYRFSPVRLIALGQPVTKVEVKTKVEMSSVAIGTKVDRSTKAELEIRQPTRSKCDASGSS
jgi:hypothetical protein